MIEPDTVQLLRKCDEGIKMAISGIANIEGRVQAEPLKQCLKACKAGHQSLARELQTLLDHYHDEGKDPQALVKGMALMESDLKLVVDSLDEAIAELMTDGCNMGIKTLQKYLNRYHEANDKAKDIVARLIKLEKKLVVELRPFL